MSLKAVKGGWVNTNPGLHALDNLPESNWIGGTLPYGWAGELVYPNNVGFDQHFQLYHDMVVWINENVANPRYNTLWNKIGDNIFIQFRKPKDMMWFTLRWAQ